MKNILIVKTSSLGDIIHTLPAVTDAANVYPEVSFDWVVEENFAEIPRFHFAVNNVIPIAFRRWRKNLFSQNTLRECKEFMKQLRSKKYDAVIDAQGLIKSGLLAGFAKGTRCGLNYRSAREFLAAIFYQKKYAVNWYQHAIIRNRDLFSQCLQYSKPTTTADYGLLLNDDGLQLNNKSMGLNFRGNRSNNQTNENPNYRKNEKPYIVFLHGTTWKSKLWSDANWISLAKLLIKNGIGIKLPWCNQIELERANLILQNALPPTLIDKVTLIDKDRLIETHHPLIEVLPRMGISAIAKVLANSNGAVAVDTGLGHLAAALNIKTISLYGPTDPKLIGTVGKNQIHLVSDDKSIKKMDIPPEQVFLQLVNNEII